MSNLLFKLNGVPEDEAEDIRDILESAEIEWYETDSGRWGLGYAAMWTREKEKVDQAKQLIKEYQTERYQNAQSELESLERTGEKISRLDFFMQSPIKFALLIIFAGLLGYFTVVPFFG
jgi:Family of unknown function (DUF6164)